MVNNVIPFVHSLLRDNVTKTDVVVDATCGNGNDTLLLAELSKFVYAFDVQDVAISNTEMLLNESNVSNYKIIQDSHENLGNYIDSELKAVTFNLGYLPGSDKSIQTSFKSTIKAIEDSLSLLVSGGIITIILYVGHNGGLDEANEVNSFSKQLNRKAYKVLQYSFINRDTSPYVIVIEKH
ncbi:Putative rRNA methylase [Candidatus Izimaplasma bacterium HR1]|jgi:SAM-dependent methyltransferase|uniref:tRNA (mnm(5)s(2)U34)-methyltransferase n=1 Tax=Candidatus Izimoplasma sp. HR1 TaxID=1541959 RepID=UPI0004F5F674|nr:Putative rRNA methylase [Candidatus Izimaplasma bacterium HR1]